MDRADSLRVLITRINRIRRENPCLHDNTSLEFHQTDNEALLCYSKRRGDNIVITVVNLDVYHRQSGWLQLDETKLAIPQNATYQVHDQLSDARYLWNGSRGMWSSTLPACRPTCSSCDIGFVAKPTSTISPDRTDDPGRQSTHGESRRRYASGSPRCGRAAHLPGGVVVSRAAGSAPGRAADAAR